MNLTYEQFLEKVPKETAEFIKLALPYLDSFLNSERALNFKKTEIYSENYYTKATMLLFYCFSQNENQASFLNQYGFDPRRYQISNKTIDYLGDLSEMFQRNSSLFTFYEDDSLYTGLMPIDIIVNSFNLYYQKCGSDIFNFLFPKINISTFKTVLGQYKDDEHAKMEQIIEKEVYENLPISTIMYIEMASKIRTILFQKLKGNKNELVNYTDDDIVPLSLLLSLFYYKTNSENDMTFNNEYIAIQECLKEMGITLSDITRVLVLPIYSSDFNNVRKNVYCLKKLYAKYYTEGKNKDIDSSEVTVSKILANLFDRSFTNSIVIEKVLAKMNCYVGTLENIETKVEEVKIKKKKLYSQEYMKSFYSGLSKDTKDFIDFTAKTYILILSKMKEKKHNDKILCDEDDADTLSLYIAANYFDTVVNEFFEDYGVTLEKTLQFLNLTITKEEIEATPLDEKVLEERFKRFVYAGVNRGKSSKSININDVSLNLCSREFNRSMIIENIFGSLTDQIKLQSDFETQLSQHLETKEQNRKMKLTQRFFRDIPVETIDYLENVSRIHHYLKQEKLKFAELDIQVFSLILGIMMLPKNEIKSFFESLGFEKNKICSYLDVYSNRDYLLRNNIDIDMLSEQYGVFVFGSKNKECERKDLNVFNVSRNIFSKEINNSVEISKFLANFGLTYEDFELFEETFQQYLDKTEENRKINEAKTILNNYQTTTSYYIKNVIKIHQRILNQLSLNPKLKDKFRDVSDVIELSFVLGLFTVHNDVVHFLKKNQFSLNNIIQINGLDQDTLLDIDKDNIDYFLLLEYYKPYIKDFTSYTTSVSDLVQKIFNGQFSKKSLILEETASILGVDYNILKQEILTKKDYELSMSIDDRINLLLTSSIDSFDLDDIKSVLHFGNSLSIHSKYIYDELPKLMLSDAHTRSIEAINGVIEQVYTKEPPVEKKKGFLSQLFAISVEEEKAKVIINPNAIQELKDVIAKNIDTLSAELLGYDQIRRYIEAYRRKNRLYFIAANSELEKIEEKMSTLTADDDSYAEFLNTSSSLQIIKNKVNRFSTSNLLMKQELLKVNQAIVNHFITINALEMARDDLLPLIGSELALGKGMDTENKALELSQSVIDLFQSLLTRNMVGAVENIEKLKQSNLPESVFAILTHDIELYLNELKQINGIEKRVENFEIDQISSVLLSNQESELKSFDINEVEKSNDLKKRNLIM